MCQNSQYAAGQIKLSTCSRCKAISYCTKGCQKKDWSYHKYVCQPANVPRHEVTDLTIESIQNAIDAASPDDIVLLKEGTYEGSGPLLINKPIKVWGPRQKMESVKLNCNLTVKPSGLNNDSMGDVVLAYFSVNGVGKMEENMYKSITLKSVKVQCPNEVDDTTLTIDKCNGKVLLLDCEIFGGGDGIRINGTDKVHIKATDIRFCKHRGIFTRYFFTIEDSEISNCGGYGIKGTCGWQQKGTSNDIQLGPWSPMGPSASGW